MQIYIDKDIYGIRDRVIVNKVMASKSGKPILDLSCRLSGSLEYQGSKEPDEEAKQYFKLVDSLPDLNLGYYCFFGFEDDLETIK